MKNGYDVRVIPGGLKTVGGALRARGLKGPVAMVCDESLVSLYAPMVQTSLEQAGYTVNLCPIPSGEAFKTIETITSLWARFATAKLERGSTVVALGGGVTGDLAGYAASAFLRGVNWVGLPTTLLSMVDASLGGKTGFDLPQGKNLVGAFYPPSLVLADPQVLASLPEGEVRSGIAEVVKHGVIADPVLYERCAAGWTALRGPDASQPDWTATVRRAMAVKIKVIKVDPFEQSVRASLNLGHTLGHAFEAASNYKLRHGEAVAIGMVAVARLAEKEELCPPGLAGQIQSVLDGLGLPTEIPSGLDPEVYLTALKLDKKRADGKVRFAVPVQIGEVQTGIVLDTNFATLLPEAR
jgi:shikimate kinase / 3-dehydroquinate synthase